MSASEEKTKPVLVTGAAGFIGYHLCERLLKAGQRVVGVDNRNTYYDVSLKDARLALLRKSNHFLFREADIADRAAMDDLFAPDAFDRVYHLAAQAGVRYSIDHPHAYAESNLTGFLNILEGCRKSRPKHLIFASSSSVYGDEAVAPFSVDQRTDRPLSLYAATKKANELMAHAYARLYAIPCTGLRFFTVYGPWGRPDMAYFSFTRAILAEEPVKVFNRGDMLRDFTFIDDIVEGIVRVGARIPEEAWGAPFKVYNIGNNRPVRLMDFIKTLEDALGRKAVMEFLPRQPGDVLTTCADVGDLESDVGFRPSTPLDRGLKAFVAWYRDYYGVL